MSFQKLGLLSEQRSNPPDSPVNSVSSPVSWGWLSGSHETDAGEIVNDTTAMKISTCYACVRVLSESVASLPVRLLRITPQGKVQELLNPLAYLLGVAPNAEMTSFVFFETITHHLVLTGNSYCEIERAQDGTPLALWPLSPRLTRPMRRPNGELCYETTEGGPKRVLDARDILHIPLTSFDGVVGLSPIQSVARTFGLSLAAEKFGSRFFANYAMPRLAIITKKLVKPEDKARMRRDWEELQSGANQHRTAILDGETDVKTLSISPEEAQFIATRVHQRSEICAIFRVPVHMAGSEQKLSNSNVEQLNLSFILDTLRPILTRIEAELVRKLLPGAPGQPSSLTVQFDLSERQRGDTAAQVSLITAGRQWGALTANDCLRLLGLPAAGPAEDVRMVPENMKNAERLLDPPQPPTTVVVNE